MNLFELFVKIGAKDEASGTISKITSGLGKGLATAAKIGTAAVGAAAAGITALTKAAVDNYAEYEQLIGGVETLYGAKYKTIEEYIEGTGAAAEYAEQTFAEYQKRQQAVLDNAANAYKTAGMSANEYMNTVNGFAASLTSSLGEYEWQAANYADMIVSDMADNANKMGTSMDMIQNAYAGFAKQNYTMLDNLKLGYGGTKTEMERLLRDAERMAGYIEGSLDIESFADIADAIHIVQEEMGITGTTALEAGRTISGSVGAMKAAWTNLLTGLADGNADIEKLVDDLVSTIAGDGTKNNLGVIGNILPAVETALDGSGKLIDKILPIVIEKIPSFIEKYLPKILQSGVNIIRTILTGISSNPNQIVSTIMSVVNTLIDAIVDLLPEIIVTGSLLLGKLAVGLIQAIPDLVSKIPQIIKSVVDGFKSKSSEFSGIGKNIVNGVWNGIKSMISTFTANVKSFFSGIVSNVKETLGIHSPSRVFAEIGGFMAKGLDEGWTDEFGNVKKDIDNSLSFDDAYMGIGASVSKVGSGMAYGGTSIGNITINIDGAKYSNEQSLASAIALEIQNMTDRRAAVYA